MCAIYHLRKCFTTPGGKQFLKERMRVTEGLTLASIHLVVYHKATNHLGKFGCHQVKHGYKVDCDPIRIIGKISVINCRIVL